MILSVDQSPSARAKQPGVSPPPDGEGWVNREVTAAQRPQARAAGQCRAIFKNFQTRLAHFSWEGNLTVPLLRMCGSRENCSEVSQYVVWSRTDCVE